jgi:hypothetical protein
MGRQKASTVRKVQLARERHEGGSRFIVDSSTSESEEEIEPTYDEVLLYDVNSKLPGKGTYSGDSRANLYKKAKLNLDAALSMGSSPKITSYFSNSPLPKPIIHEAPLLTLQEALAQLEVDCSVSKSALNPSISPHELTRRLALKMYFSKLKEGEGKMDSSLLASRSILGKGVYGATCVREWAEEYLLAGDLFHHQQGAHPKIKSLLLNPTFIEKCKIFLEDAKPESRGPLALKKFVESSVLPTLSVSQTTISETTCRTFMKKWGYMFKAHTKGVYMDGHERVDVVDYRQEFVVRMVKYQESMISYGDDGMEEILPSLKAGEKRIVFVAHDESAFHQNDAKGSLWMKEHEQLLRKKGEGRAYMVSGFLCPCHGIFDDEYISPGKNADGYWRCPDLARQVERMLVKFKELHPDCRGLFVFDQSSNHGAMADDALVATRMNLNPKGANVPKMRNGWFMKNGEKVTQPMVDEKGEPKGIKAVLVERGLWRDQLKLDCDGCPDGSTSCCARKIISLQPDFQEQRSVIAEIIEKNHQIIEFFPKFHCELNPIERVWGYAKRIARADCSFNFSDLKTKVPLILKGVPLSTIRAFYRRVFRYVSAYNLGLDGVVAEWSVKKFKSHRKISGTVEKIMEIYVAENKK